MNKSKRHEDDSVDPIVNSLVSEQEITKKVQVWFYFSRSD